MIKERLCVTLDVDIIRRLKGKAKEDGTTLSHVVRDVIVKGLTGDDSPTDVLVKVELARRTLDEVASSIIKARAKRAGKKQKDNN